MKFVALLPMKAHSERVPGKNFREFIDKPLFKWILDSLLECEQIEQVLINTDARNELKQNGLTENSRVKIRDRKPELCGDLVSMNLILQDDIKSTDADYFIMTHTTNPLLTSRTINDAIEKFKYESEANDFDSLFGVTKYQTRFYSEDGSAINHDPENLMRTQDLEPWYEENSCIYIFSKSSFSKTNARIGEKPVLFTIPKLEAVDIDEKEDWFLAKAVARSLKDGDNFV